MPETKWQSTMPWHSDAIIVAPNARHWKKEDNERFAKLFVSLPRSELLKVYPGQTYDGLKARAWRLGISAKDQGKPPSAI